jgi:hypothetical protein
LPAQLGFLSAQSFLCKSYFTAGCELRLGFFHELSGLGLKAEAFPVTAAEENHI